MKIKTLQTILIFFVFGIISGFLSLVLMTLVPLKFANNETVISISLLASIEEIVKFFFIYFIFSTHSLGEFPKILKLIIFPIFLGLGFSFFELSLIFFRQTSFPIEAFYPTIVHILSAIILTSATNLILLKRFSVYAFMLLLLSVFIHICYNVTIVKII